MKLYVPAGSTQISYRGMNIDADADGSISVPAESKDELMSVGCTESPVKPASKDQKAAQTKSNDKVQNDLVEAETARNKARDALFAVEGRGDTEAVDAALATLDAAESAVNEAGEKI